MKKYVEKFKLNVFLKISRNNKALSVKNSFVTIITIISSK